MHAPIGQLVRSFLPHGLIDEYLLMIRPLVLGSGQRLFDHDDHVAELRLLSSTSTTTGVILATYQSESVYNYWSSELALASDSYALSASGSRSGELTLKSNALSP